MCFVQFQSVTYIPCTKLRLFTRQNEQSSAVFFLIDLFVYVFCTIWPFYYCQKVHFERPLSPSSFWVWGRFFNKTHHLLYFRQLYKYHISTRHAKHAHDRNGEIKRSFGQNFGMDSGPFRYFLHFVCFLDVANREAERPLSPSSISKCYLYPLHKTAIIYTTKRTVEYIFS